MAAPRSTGFRVAKRSRSCSKLGVDVLVGDLGHVDLDLERGEVRQLDVRTDVDLGGEGQRHAVGELTDLDVGLTEHLQLVLVDRVAVGLGERLVDRLVEHGAASDPLVDDARRHLALAETGDRHLRGDLLVGRVDAGLQLVEGDLDGQSHSGRAQGLDVALHVPGTPWSPGPTAG